jgi:hypothetical protein
VPPPSPAALLHDHFKKWKLIDSAIQGNFPNPNFNGFLTQKSMRKLEIGHSVEFKNIRV